jgi:hypothetical protein
VSRELIAKALKGGPRWTRSFQNAKATLNAMIAEGEVHTVRPEGGVGRNMVELTGRGWARYFGVDRLVTLEDRLAERLAEGDELSDAGVALGLRARQTWAVLANMTRHVGEEP